MEGCRTKEQNVHSKTAESEKQNLKIENYEGRRKIIKLREKGSSKRKLQYEVEERFKLMKKRDESDNINAHLECDLLDDEKENKEESIPDKKEGLISLILRLKSMAKETNAKLEKAKSKLKSLEMKELEEIK